MLILCLTASMVWAERIDVATARKVAESVAQRENFSGLRSVGELPLVYAAAPGQSGSALRSGTMEGAADYFVFNFPGEKGFAIVAGDDRVRPVLGYSNEGGFDPDNLPENFRGMLAYYQEQIDWVVSRSIEASPALSAEWSRYMSGTTFRASKSGEKVIETAKWNQGDPYNRQTPTIGGKHSVTGCVATAAAIIMRYHEYPKTAVTGGVTSYNPNNDRNTFDKETFPVTYAAYDWNNMPLNYPASPTSAQANAVSALMWNIGANIDMDYSLESSGASMHRAAAQLHHIFGYGDELRVVRKSNFTWEDWYKLIRTEIDANRPVFYDGQNKAGGHAFVCDGYADGDYFHFNWGWGGYANNFTLLSVMLPEGSADGYGWNIDNTMAIGIKPASTGDQKIKEIRYTDLYTAIAPLPAVGATFTAGVEFTNTGNMQFDALVNLAVIDASGAWKKNIGEKNHSAQLGFDTKYYAGYSKYTGKFTCNLEQSLASGEKILPVYSLDNGATWIVMGKSEEAPECINQKGTIPAGDDLDNPTRVTMEGKLDYNPFNNAFMLASGLENAANRLGGYNMMRLEFIFKNASQDAILRFTFPEMTAWASHLKIYYGSDDKINSQGQGTLVSANADGEVEIPLSGLEISNSVVYVKILSDKVGTLDYDLRLFAASDRQNPLYEEIGKQMRFISIPDYGIEPNPLRGVKGQAVEFKLSIRELDALVIHPNMSLRPSIYSAVDLGDIALYRVEGSKETKVELSKRINGSIYAYSGNLNVESVRTGQEFTFRLKGVNQELGTTNDNWANIAFSITSNYTYIPAIDNSTRMIFTTTAPKVHNVTLNIENLLAERVSTVEDQHDLRIQLTPKNGFNLPAMIEIRMGDRLLTSGTDYQYDGTTGTIGSLQVTADVTITAIGVRKPVPTYGVTVNVTNLPAVTAEAVEESKDLTLTLSGNDTYDLPETIAVTMGGVTLTKDAGYTYDPATGVVVVKAVTGEIVITAVGKKKPVYFTIKQELTNLTSDKSGEIKVLENTKQELSLTVAESYYKLPGGIRITDAEGNTFADFTYDKSTGKIVIDKVTSDLTIVAVAIDDRHYDVVFDLNGVNADPTAIPPFEINTKASFTVKLAAAEGYDYDGTISVKMGDKTLAAGTDYTYDKETGAFALANGITATLTITAKAVKKQYTITVTCTSLTPMEVPNSVAHGDPLSFKYVPDEGYNLPEAIEVKMGGTVLTAGEGYTYNKADGTVSIAKVTGKVEVAAVGVVKQYAVTLNLTNLTSDLASGTKATHGEPLDIQLTAPAGYQLPKAVTVKMNGQPDPNFTYENGKISITKVLGPIEITAAAVKIHAVDETVENVTIEGTDNVAQGETFAGTIQPASGYNLPYAISVTMNGHVLRAGEYTYDNVTGEVKIPNVSGPISIFAKGVQDGYFEVIFTLSNLTSDPASFEPQAKDTEVELTLKPSSGYELPSAITVKMGEATLVAGTDYTYDKSTGKFSLEKITDRLLITANGYREPDPEPEPEPTPITYTVTLPVVEGATITAVGSTSVTEGNNFSFTVDVKEGYNADNMVVKANGTTLMPDANGRYTIANIRSNVVVTVSGIVKGDSPTANEAVEPGVLRVWSSGSRLFIQTPVADTAYIVAFDGRLYKTLSLPVGEYTEEMPRGSYIIYIGKQSYKLKF